MYNAIAVTLAVITAPLWLPVAIFLAYTMSWKDTVPEGTVTGDYN